MTNINPNSEEINVISISGLFKNFGKTTALDGLDLKVARGEVHGFLGPNGSGKSTTIRILLGLLRKDGGEVSLLGKDPFHQAVDLHRRLSYIPGEVNLWPNLTGGQAIDILCGLRGAVDTQKKDELIQRFSLDPTKKFRTYSKGNRQKVAIISALASDVELYVMDEPTSGLDPLMNSVFAACVKELKEEGKTVLLSSHTLSEVEALCDKVTIIREGKTVESGSIEELRHLTRMYIKVTTSKQPEKLAQLAGVHDIRVEGNQAEFEVEKEELKNVIRYLADLDIKDLISRPPTLGELFMRHYSDSGRDVNKTKGASS